MIPSRPHDRSTSRSRPGLTRVWDVDEVLFEGDTAFQHVLIGRTAQGVSLFCDNDRQSTEFSQLTYHEALMVPALLLADQVDRVLVVGSSEGVVCQIAVAAGATRVDHVDIDEQAVRLCARHLPYGYTRVRTGQCASAATARSRVHYADGWEFVRHGRRSRYDIVLVDLPDERDGGPDRTAQPALRRGVHGPVPGRHARPAGSWSTRPAARRCGATKR